MKESLTYADAGVDIDKANKLVDTIKEIAKLTHRPGVMSEIGGFGGLLGLALGLGHRFPGQGCAGAIAAELGVLGEHPVGRVLAVAVVPDHADVDPGALTVGGLRHDVALDQLVALRVELALSANNA